MFQGKKLYLIIRNIVEIYVPCFTFISMFCLFIIQIFFRYCLRDPLSWTMEPISILFLWTVLFGSCYAFRTDQHIKFSLFYDKMPKRYAELTAFIGNLIVLVLMVLSFVPSVKFIDFMKIQSSSVLRISMRIIYLPYLIFLAISIIYTACEMKSEWKNVLKGKKASQRKDET